MIEVAYQEINAKFQIISKRKEFKTETAMRKFFDKLEEKGTLHQILGTRSDSLSW